MTQQNELASSIDFHPFVPWEDEAVQRLETPVLFDTEDSLGRWDNPGIYAIIGAPGRGKSLLATSKLMETQQNDPNRLCVYLSAEEPYNHWFADLPNMPFSHLIEQCSTNDKLVGPSQLLTFLEERFQDHPGGIMVIDSINAIPLAADRSRFDQEPGPGGQELLQQVGLMTALDETCKRLHVALWVIIQDRPGTEYSDVTEVLNESENDRNPDSEEELNGTTEKEDHPLWLIENDASGSLYENPYWLPFIRKTIYIKDGSLQSESKSYDPKGRSIYATTPPRDILLGSRNQMMEYMETTKLTTGVFVPGELFPEDKTTYGFRSEPVENGPRAKQPEEKPRIPTYKELVSQNQEQAIVEADLFLTSRLITLMATQQEKIGQLVGLSQNQREEFSLLLEHWNANGFERTYTERSMREGHPQITIAWAMKDYPNYQLIIQYDVLSKRPVSFIFGDIEQNVSSWSIAGIVTTNNVTEHHIAHQLHLALLFESTSEAEILLGSKGDAFSIKYYSSGSNDEFGESGFVANTTTTWKKFAINKWIPHSSIYLFDLTSF